MTFKTDIKFDESPVLRSLEKVAVDKGLVKPEPITKEASASEVYAPTEDLHEDMLKLVAGLRAKGFEKEAEALEDKINVRKFAETHLYHVIDEEGDELLDFAHPEGDVEVAPSASGLGKVWTEQSAKKEIEKIVRKQPTGKNAARGADVKKFAADYDEDQLNTEIAALYDELHAAKEAAKSGLGATPEYWTFKEDGVLSNSANAKYYSELSGISAEQISNYKKLLMAAYGSAEVGDENAIYNRIMQGSNWGDLSKLTGTEYFWGSKPFSWTDAPLLHKEKPGGKWGNDNVHAILAWNGWKFIKHSGTAWNAARHIQSIVKQKRKAVFGDNLATASKGALKRAKKFEALVDKSFGKLEVPMLKRDENDSLAKSAASILGRVRAIGTNVVSLGNKAVKRRYDELVKKFGSESMSWDAFDSALETAMEPLGRLVEKLKPLAEKGPAKTAANNFAKAASIFASYMAWLESEGYRDAPEYAASQRGMEKSRQYANVVNVGVKKGKMDRAYNLIEVDSDEALLAASNSWLASVQQYTGMQAPMKAEAPAEADDAVYAATDAEIMKSAQLAFDPGGGGAKPKAPTAPRQPSGPRRPGTRPSPGAGSGMKQQRPGVKSFAGVIQQALLDLASYLKSIKGHPNVISVLEMKPHGKDNMWGEDTVKAVNMAETIRKKYKVKSPQIVTQNTKATADNIKALLTAIKSAKGPGMKQGEVYDELSHGDKVTSMNLMSPYSFYEFTIKSLGQEREIDPESGLEMVSINNFESWMKHLHDRARTHLKEATDDKARQLAGKYIRAIKALWGRWNETLKYAAKEYTRRAGGEKATGGITYTTETVRGFGKIPVSFLRASGGAPDFGGPGTGAGFGMRQQRGPGGGIRIELADDAGGRAGEVPEDVVPPITRYINLGDDMWDLDLKVILDYNEFRRMSGPEFATTFFSDEGGDAGADASASDLMEAALKAGYPRNAILYDPKSKQVKIWAVQSGMPWEAGQWVLAKDNPIVTGKLSGGAVSHPNARALNFIRDFRAEISRVYKDWASNILSGNYEKRKEFSSLILGQARRWQKKLSRMENDIKRANMRARRRRR